MISWRQLGLPGWALGRRAAVFPQARGSFPRRGASITVGRRMARRASARALGNPRCVSRGRRAVRHPEDSDDFNTGDNEGIGYFHVNQQRGRRWSAARGFLKPVLQPAEPAAWKPACHSRARRRRRAAAPSASHFRAGRRDATRRAPRRGHPVGGRDRLAAAAGCSPASGRPSGCRALGIRSCSTSRASARICRIICNCA